MNPKNEKEKIRNRITREQAEYIMGDDKKYLKLIEDNVYCGNCSMKKKDVKSVTIVDHFFYIDSFGDIVMDGKCKLCGGHVVRCTETGEDKEKYARAQEIIKNRDKKL